MVAEILVVEARGVHAPAINIDLQHFGGVLHARRQSREGVVIVPADEIHAARLRLGQDFRNHVDPVVIRSTEIVQNRVAEVFRVVVAEGSAVVILFESRLTMIRKLFGAQPAMFISVGISPDGIHSGLFLHDVQHLVGALIFPAKGRHLDGDIGLPQFCPGAPCSALLGLRGGLRSLSHYPA